MINSNDNPINILISELRKFSEQISLLLKTADHIFQKQDWLLLKGDVVTSNNSASIDNPQKWFPEFFCRFYANNNYPNVQAYIGIILDNRSSNSEYDFEEPIITSGYFWGIENINKVEMWRCRWHVYTSNKNYKGMICTLDPKDWKKSHEKNFKYLKSLALPLVNISTSDDLDKKVIGKLLDELRSEKIE